MGAVMRYQPQGRIRPRAGVNAIGFVMGDSPSDAFGRASDLIYSGSPAKVANAHGLARKFVAASLQYATAAPPEGLVNFAEPFAVVMAFVADSVSTSTRLLNYGDAFGTTCIQLITISSRLAFLRRVGNGASAVNSTDVIEAGKPYVVVAGFDGAAPFMSINGVAQAGPTSASIANPAVGTTINIARRGDNATHFNGQVSMFAHIKGQVDAQALSLNPWQVFQASDEEYETPAAVQARHTITVAPSAQQNASSLGATQQRHKIGGSTASQASASNVAAVGQRHRVAGGESSQAGGSSAAAVSQRHRVTGAASSQHTASSIATLGAIRHGLAGTTGSQSNASSTAAAKQQHRLAGAGATQAGTSGTGTASQRHRIAAGAAIQQNFSVDSTPSAPVLIDLPDSRIYRGPAERRILRANPERRVHRGRKQ